MKLCRIFIASVLVLLISSCAKRIPVSYQKVEDNQYVNVRTRNGESFEGIVKAKQETYLVLQKEAQSKSLNKIARNNITEILSAPPVYDYENKIISEFDIQKIQHGKNARLFTIGGAALSFGTSFFAGSLLQRGLASDDSTNAVMWGVTGVGTIAGTGWFFHKGKTKDRAVAIEAIRDYRYRLAEKEMEKNKGRKQEVSQEMEKIKQERARQDEELKRLMERLKQREETKEKQ
ncbi:hypothetical protein JW960_24305 [candidate division KSB1 bacterium]|nr:hypothetical protein [candidate division KSB1 bacterium]